MYVYNDKRKDSIHSMAKLVTECFGRTVYSMRLKIFAIGGLLFTVITTAIAGPPAPPGASVGHVNVRIKPTWIWVASVKSASSTDATLALARANVSAVFQGSPVLQVYVHPVEASRATVALRKDAAAKHYQVNFDLKTATPKSKKPSH
jgi:hypothetical protein